MLFGGKLEERLATYACSQGSTVPACGGIIPFDDEVVVPLSPEEVAAEEAKKNAGFPHFNAEECIALIAWHADSPNGGGWAEGCLNAVDKKKKNDGGHACSCVSVLDCGDKSPDRVPIGVYVLETSGGSLSSLLCARPRGWRCSAQAPVAPRSNERRLTHLVMTYICQIAHLGQSLSDVVNPQSVERHPKNRVGGAQP